MDWCPSRKTAKPGRPWQAKSERLPSSHEMLPPGPRTLGPVNLWHTVYTMYISLRTPLCAKRGNELYWTYVICMLCVCIDLIPINDDKKNKNGKTKSMIMSLKCDISFPWWQKKPSFGPLVELLRFTSTDPQMDFANSNWIKLLMIIYFGEPQVPFMCIYIDIQI